MGISKAAVHFSLRAGMISAVFAILTTSGVTDVRAASYAPPYSELVVDARSGKVLRAINADQPRHPASITKVMTLYLLFEQLDAGKMTLSTPIKVSDWAARQAPSKLGLAPGETLTVDEAIKAIVTRSANDIAVAVAESIGGSEQNFAAMMTQKAKSIGMTRTVYANASGLPNPRQITTARDLVVLGRSIQSRFPRYFQYFSLRSFDYDGATIANHNKLLGRVDGVDGIKTGYTAKSGFNLLTSVHSEGRSLLAVILGGRTATMRDRRMAELVDSYLQTASTEGAKAPAKTAKAIAPAPTPVDVERPNSDNEDVAENTTASLSPPPAAKQNQSDTKLVWKPGAAPAAQAKALGYAETSAAPSSDEKDRVWWIQVGVAQNEGQAKSLVTSLSGGYPALLGNAKPVIEKVRVNGRDMWRTRFTRMSLESAQAACQNVKKQGGACFASRS